MKSKPYRVCSGVQGCERRQSPERGYSFSEMLVAASILAIMSLVAIPRIRQFHAQIAIDSLSSDFLSSLRLGRDEALAPGSSTVLCRIDRGSTALLANGTTDGCFLSNKNICKVQIISVALTRTLRSACQGLGLIEILVTMLLLSVGLLGFIGLQTLALQAERSAFYRSSASIIATDAAERIRANRAGFTASGYASSLAEESDSCFEAAGCSSEALAQAELYELQGTVAEVLPSGVFVVCLDGTLNDGSPTDHACDGSNSMIAIKIWWDDNRDGVAETLVSTGVAFL
ncbi:MAG: type IV pilus modification protein PilV [Pseudomonadales bacterium]|nr:type IV pilus modification protein PilV [Pseudomonadales bacterium]